MAEETKEIRKPLPEITPINQPFWDGAKAGKLMMQKCKDCGTWVFCPRPVCGDCASDKLEWAQLSGRGKIFSFTVIREVVGQALRGFAPDIPYVTAWIDLDEFRPATS
ncbi:MAG: OB-fold domain-containing protein [Deltaproteobacteria bacterium]|nr:OB-fold domain-containing protein [Deltaproteobacteria bacterium]